VPVLRIALAQINSTVGDLDGNAAAIISWTRKAAEAGASMVVFPEMMLTGYPVEDLALRASFVEASIAALWRTAADLAEAGLGGIAVVTGYLDRQSGLLPRVGLPAGAPLDAAAVLHGGAVAITSAKHHLPNYGVFDEYRYFVPGEVLPVVRIGSQSGQPVDVAVAICEDLWQDGGPVAVACAAGASLLVVPNASPYEQNKGEARLALCACPPDFNASCRSIPAAPRIMRRSALHNWKDSRTCPAPSVKAPGGGSRLHRVAEATFGRASSAMAVMAAAT